MHYFIPFWSLLFNLDRFWNSLRLILGVPLNQGMELPVPGQSQWGTAWLVLWAFAVCVRGGFVEPPPSFSLRSLTEVETRLPCQFQVQEEEQVVQVSWFKELPDGTKEQIITAHLTEGHTEFGRYSGRVRFESSSPTVDSALLIMNTEESYEGKYTCHISTFPYGNFERQLSLTVWSKTNYFHHPLHHSCKPCDYFHCYTHRSHFLLITPHLTWLVGVNHWRKYLFWLTKALLTHSIYLHNMESL